MNARVITLASSVACLFLAVAVSGGEPDPRPVKRTIRADDGLAQLPQFGLFFDYFRPISRRKSFVFPARVVPTRCSANLPS